MSLQMPIHFNTKPFLRKPPNQIAPTNSEQLSPKKNKKQKMPIKLLLLLPLFAYLVFQCCTGKLETKNNNGSAGGSIKGMFVFGSSLVDNGNNNFLENSLARADYLPYGVDFPWGPSGRFTNGKNVIDLLGEKLKLPSLIPTFSDSSTKGTKIVHGVNFASAASGILDDTGSLAYPVFRGHRELEHEFKHELERELQLAPIPKPKTREQCELHNSHWTLSSSANDEKNPCSWTCINRNLVIHQGIEETGQERKKSEERRENHQFGDKSDFSSTLT
ncbi:hypothetical protein ACOSQ3_027219 [Xanthoceras sorbifolium]